MDIQTGIIYGSIVVVCAVAVFAISMFGIKEKTYDEAIAEQRLIPSEHLLLGRSSKDKSKEKKVKKTAAGKKVKEKLAVEQDKNYQKEVAPEVPAMHHEKSHVEFEPDAEVITSEHPHQEEKKKKKKMKPILINKEEHSAVVTGAPVLANHFEESLPKDDLLLKRRMSMENLGYAKSAAPAKGKSDKVSVPKAEKLTTSHVDSVGVAKPDKVEKATSKGEKAKAVATKVEKAVVEEVVVASFAEREEAAPIPVVPAVKDQRPSGSRKKKSELAALQQMTGDREGVNVSLIVPLVQKAELSRSEIQILIDLLLNKQQNSAEFNSEWIEGRQDPMVKLKKQLAEKEKLLADEQEASQAFQNKLKELRAEINTDRSRWRQLEETVAAKQLELQHAATRLQHAQDAHKAEKANMQQQVQQLQAKVGEDHAIIRKLQEDQGQAQGVMQQEMHGQRQQLELHVVHVMEKHKEAEAVLTSQINQLHAQLQEQENIHKAVRAELQNMRENAIACDSENKILREKMNHLGKEAQRQESQLEEMHHLKTKLEHHVNKLSHTESQTQYEKEQLLQELESVKEAFAKVADVKTEMVRLQTERDGLLQTVKGVQTERDGLMQTVKGLQAEAQQSREERERLSSKVAGLSNDSQRLREENDTLAAQVAAAAGERPAAEGRENGDVHFAEIEKKQDESLRMDSLLKQKEAEVADLSSQIINYKTEISRLSNECEAQRQKNNETSTSVRLEEQAATKQLLERLFPEVSIAGDSAHSAWLKQFETSASVALATLRTHPADSSGAVKAGEVEELEAQVAQLQGNIQKYKTIITETELLLKKLQEGAEETDAELEAVKEERDRLEQSLEEVLGARQEKDRLQSELAAAQEKEHEMTKELTKLRSLVEMGGDSHDSQHPVDKLNGVTEHHSVATNGSETESSNAESLSVASEPMPDSDHRAKPRGRKKKGGSGKK